MLSEILELFENHHPMWCSDEIARELGEDPVFISGMLDHLVHMGRLNRESGREGCSTCRVQHSCVLVDLDKAFYTLSSLQTRLPSSEPSS